MLVVALGGLIFVPGTSALSGEAPEVLNKGNQNTAPTDQRAADDTDKDNDGFPDGSYDLLMIGDSVSLRAVDSFDGVFPHCHIDAEKGRQFDAGRATPLRSYIQQNLAGKIVVFALGTNGLVTDDQIDAIMADAGDKRIVVFVNTRSPQPWVGSTNQAIANAATRYKNVRVIGWYGYSANRNDLFDGDGTHLSTTGVTEYLNLIHDAVEGPARASRNPVNDPQPAAVRLPPTRSSMRSLSTAQAGHRQVTCSANFPHPEGARHGRHPLRRSGRSYVPAPRDTPDTAERTPSLAPNSGRLATRALFQAPHPQQTTQNRSFSSRLQRSWTKVANMRYCYHFSSRQNHPKMAHGSARPFQLTRMAAGLGDRF